MIYVLDTDKRMHEILLELQGTIYKNNVLNENDCFILPLRWENLLHDLNKIKKGVLFLPYSSKLFPTTIQHAYMEDEKVLRENAKLTALGLLQFMVENQIDYFKNTIDIIGYGRCSKALIYLFDYLNVKYRVIYYKENDNTILNDVYLKDKLSNVVINTADINIFKENKSYDNTIFIDISSNKILRSLCCKNKVLFPGSLPEKYYANLSASLICDYIRGKSYAK